MNQREIDKYFYEIWFKRAVSEITMVAPPSFDGLEDAELSSRNFALLDRCGDRDTIFALGKLLSRKYPKAHINLVTSDDLKHTALQRNLVIVGGPGGATKDGDGVDIPFEGNSVCRIFSQTMSTKISYTDDCEGMLVNGRPFHSAIDRDGHMCLDYGYFASFRNPYLLNARVVMLHGTHTLGVLGASRLFEPAIDAASNYSLLKSISEDENSGAMVDFESFFSVEVTKGNVICPSIVKESLYSLGGQDDRQVSQASGVFVSNPSEYNVVKQSIVDTLKIARNETEMSAKRSKLEIIMKIVLEGEDVPHVKLLQIREILDRNGSIPNESIVEIEGALGSD
jgi:hypothetical protein